MKLIDWRKERQLTLADMASMIGLSGSNPARDLQRFETGERRPPATVVQAIFDATNGEVTPQDMHDCRLGWERQNLAAAE
ncbi:helix-turn-helix domain-containing protein [Pelagibacterium limicola]|uniref:helix-turn-helix domain-containing protein n=1 Tax=Pelagibacterium limicola TaxID=2791022 RepID=UPI0018AFB279|nr:helix-turn-helix transcriptional regulator [Pelagibacterium limicola]